MDKGVEKGIEKAIQVATRQTVKKLLDNPQEAAKIPTKFIRGKIDGMIQLFEGSWSLKDRYRSLQLTFCNLTSSKIHFDSDYFDSGTWYNTWRPQIPPLTVTQGTVANQQGSVACGVTGGIKLKVCGDNFYLYIGFNNPCIGGYKYFFQASESKNTAEYAYQKSENNSPKISHFKKYKLQAVMTDSSIAQKAFVFQISEK